jgi:hypothetical protein
MNMKNITIILSALFLLISCQKESRIETSEKTVVTYEVQAPVEFEIKSTGSGQELSVNALWYGVYHKKGNGYDYMSDMSAHVAVTDASKKISVPITLFKDQEYKIIFVAQHIKTTVSASGDESNCYTYTVNKQGLMSLNPKAIITDGEQLDAFVYWEETGVVKNDYKKDIELSRPLAQINISTSATEAPKKITVEVSGTAESYDIFAKKYATQTAVLTFPDLECNGTDLATVYVLPASNSVNLKLTMKYAGGTEVTKEVQSVSVAPNFKTNLTGNI